MSIPGYTHGSTSLASSPITLSMFAEMQKSALFGAEDVRHLRLSYEIVEPQVEAILDVWYGFIGSQSHLIASFADKAGRPSSDYLAAVRRRFGQWILDTARAEYDQSWLDYQHEIALRHHRLKKNLTDGVSSTAIVPFRHLFPVVFPVTATLRPFLAKSGHAGDTVDGMHSAWLKSCLLQLTLWSYPYTQPGDF